MTNQHELPLLAGIASAIRWVEELANLIAGPLLTELGYATGDGPGTEPRGDAET